MFSPLAATSSKFIGLVRHVGKLLAWFLLPVDFSHCRLSPGHDLVSYCYCCRVATLASSGRLPTKKAFPDTTDGARSSSCTQPTRNPKRCPLCQHDLVVSCKTVTLSARTPTTWWAEDRPQRVSTPSMLSTSSSMLEAFA
jgi:hypothetical protein